MNVFDIAREAATAHLNVLLVKKYILPTFEIARAS